MCDFVLDEINRLLGTAEQAVAYVYDTVGNACNFLGRTVDKIVDKHFLPEVRDVIKRAFRGIVATIAMMNLPSPLIVALWLSYRATSIFLNDFIPDEAKANINAGVGVAWIISSIHSLVQGLIFNKPELLLASAFGFLGSGLFLVDLPPVPASNPA